MTRARRCRRQRAAHRRLNQQVLSILKNLPSQRVLMLARDRREALETHTGMWQRDTGIVSRFV